MSLLLESIKYQDGEFYNLPYHEARMHHAFKKVFGLSQKIKLRKQISVPKHVGDGLYKCRIVYDTQIRSVQFEKYKRKKITALQLVHDEDISYTYKYEDRECLLKHSRHLDKGEEIIIVKKGLLRDASYSNIALYNGSEWHTPTYPLLKGTKRAELLEKGLLQSKKIKPSHLKRYSRISFINALNDLNELYLDL